MVRVLIICLFSVFQLGFTQTGFITSPHVISTVGGNWIQNNFNLSFTVGEIAVVTYAEQSVILSQGFHQENYQVVNLSEFLSNYNISVFPNPTKDQLNISFDMPNTLATIKMTDINGKIFYIKPEFLTLGDHAIELVNLAPGTYWLEIIIAKSERIVYQIQKIN